jgi:DNA methyltransferase 1-associated protein 1
MELRKELRVVEAQLRKLKKSGGHLLAAAASGVGGGANVSAISSAASSRNPSRSVSPVNIAENSQVLDQSFASTAPVPMPKTPYLQSGRLVPPATGPNGINKSLLQRMDHILGELHIPPRPIPTKRVCDLYDAVRKDILTLITLQKLTMQREGTLQSKRVKLAKLGGASLPPEDRALDEEKLLGIVQAPPKPAPTTAGMARPKVVKKKIVPGGAKKLVKKAPAVADPESSKPPAASPKDGGATASGKKKVQVIKRKRKIDPSKPGAVGAPGKAAPSVASAAKPAAASTPASASASAKKRARKSL